MMNSGGVEGLFDGVKQHKVKIPAKFSPLNSNTKQGVNIQFLIHWIVENLLVAKDRVDDFVQGDSV